MNGNSQPTKNHPSRKVHNDADISACVEIHYATYALLSYPHIMMHLPAAQQGGLDWEQSRWPSTVRKELKQCDCFEISLLMEPIVEYQFAPCLTLIMFKIRLLATLYNTGMCQLRLHYITTVAWREIGRRRNSRNDLFTPMNGRSLNNVWRVTYALLCFGPLKLIFHWQASPLRTLPVMHAVPQLTGGHCANKALKIMKFKSLIEK